MTRRANGDMTISVMVSADEHTELVRLAEEQHTSVAQLFRQGLNIYLEQHGSAILENRPRGRPTKR
jgi:hypothetical protein